MASKYMTGGTPTYTLNTRVIAGITMSAGFDAQDVGKGIVFRIGTGIFWSRLKLVASATQIELERSPHLPLSSGTVAELILMDAGEDHAYQDYLDQVRANIQDAANKLTTDTLATLLAGAVRRYGMDKGVMATEELTSDGSTSYLMSTLLGDQWQDGSTIIDAIEYPTGSTPPTFLGTEEYTLQDDGSAQDGSGIRLLFVGTTPATGEKFRLRYNRALRLPEVGAANFADTDVAFQNITDLASAQACEALAAVYAPAQDNVIVGDSVNYGEKSSRYLTLARGFRKRYNMAVFGTDDGGATAAGVLVEVPRTNEEGYGRLFHGRPR